MPVSEIPREFCAFPSPSENDDRRTFTVGETVCWRNPQTILNPNSPTYIGTYLGPDTNPKYYRIETGSGSVAGFNSIFWGHTGKVVQPSPVRGGWKRKSRKTHRI